jgi:hypothetical protein
VEPEQETQQDNESVQQYLTRNLNARLRDTSGMELEPRDFGKHIGGFAGAVKDGATLAELETVVQHMANRLPSFKKMTVSAALDDVRSGKHSVTTPKAAAPEEKEPTEPGEMTVEAGGPVDYEVLRRAAWRICGDETEAELEARVGSGELVREWVDLELERRRSLDAATTEVA